MAMPRHAIANDRAIEHVQRGEQGRRAIPFVVVRLPGRDSRPQRQERLSAVEGLDLTFLVDAEHQGFVGRIQIKPDHIVEFLDEALVAAELEGFDQVRFQVVLPRPTQDRTPGALSLTWKPSVSMTGNCAKLSLNPPDRYTLVVSQTPILLGTSSFTASGWNGSFYPQGMKPSDYLTFYAERFQTVEVDSTFYACPTARTVENWNARTPDGFAFSVKVPQTITHDKVLVDCDAEIAEFSETMDILGPKLGP